MFEGKSGSTGSPAGAEQPTRLAKNSTDVAGYADACHLAWKSKARTPKSKDPLSKALLETQQGLWGVVGPGLVKDSINTYSRILPLNHPRGYQTLVKVTLGKARVCLVPCSWKSAFKVPAMSTLAPVPWKIMGSVGSMRQWRC